MAVAGVAGVQGHRSPTEQIRSSASAPTYSSKTFGPTLIEQSYLWRLINDKVTPIPFIY